MRLSLDAFPRLSDRLQIVRAPQAIPSVGM
jgi:hypothetical protein